MPENKKETNVDSVKKLGDFKATKLADLMGDISREKSRANVIMASIKAKRDALIAKAEDEAKAKAEAEAKVVEEVKVEKEVKAPEKKAEVKAETPAPKEVKAEKIVEEVKKVEPVKPVSKEAEAPKTQQKAAETSAKKIDTPVQEAKKEEKAHIVVTPKTPFELVQENPEILPNGWFTVFVSTAYVSCVLAISRLVEYKHFFPSTIFFLILGIFAVFFVFAFFTLKNLWFALVCMTAVLAISYVLFIRFLTKEVKIAIEFLPAFLFNFYAFLCTLCIAMNN